MAADLLGELYRRGVRLRLSASGLEVIAPPGALTPSLREELRDQRDALIALLRESPERPDPAAAPGQLTGQPLLAAEPFPLTDIQHAYWVGRNPSVELGGVATHYYVELDCAGLDPDRLAASLRQVIARHEMLRAVIGPDDKQRILPDVPPYDFAVADLRGQSGSAQAAGLQQVRDEMASQVRPADQWPLFEFRLTRLDDSRGVLHASIDLLIADGYSMYLLLRDWQRFYSEPSWSPPVLPFTYRDYVIASDSLRSGTEYRQAQEYWQGRLAELPPAPALPLARPLAQVTRPDFTRHRGHLAAPQWSAIKRAGQRRGLTPSMVLLAVFADVIRLWAERPDFTLNLSLFRRPPLHPLIGEVIGDFTSVTLLGVPAPDGESFAARAAALQQQLLTDLEHASYSGVRVMRDLVRQHGSAGPAATMPIVFTSVIGHGTSEADAGAGLFGGRGFFGSFRYGISQTPQVALDHQVAEEGGELYINWDAVEVLFPSALLDDMFAVYLELLSRLSRGEGWDDQAPAVLPGSQADERCLANATAAPGRPRTLCELAEERAASQPGAVAVIDDTGQLRYGEVIAQAHRLARYLARLGAGRGDVVAVVLDKSRDVVPVLLGITESGAAYLPIEPDWPEARRWYLLEQSGARTVVTSPALRDRLTWPTGVDAVTLSDPGVAGADSGPLLALPAAEDLAYVIFTSGSTGQPKGVMIEHASAANTIEDINRRFGVGAGDVMLALSALSFDLSVYDVFGALAAGATVVMPTPGSQHDPVHWADLMARHQVTVWNSVPALMQAWLDARPQGTDPELPLRLVMLSGDWIPVTQPDAVRAAHPGAEVVSLGGATEAAIWSVWYPIGTVPPEWTRIPYGKPLANQTLHVYDQSLRPRPVWATGEIYIGGAGLARGYLHDDQRTAERFITHPATGARLYRTGDLGRYLPGGDIEFLGRADSQVKINGYRIELGEIAAALIQLPGVRDALVDVDVNPVTGRRQLAAYVVPADGQAGSADEPESEDLRWAGAVAAAAARRQDGAAAQARELGQYHELITAFNAACPYLIARTLARLGWFTSEGETATADDIVERCGIKLRYRWLVGQWLDLLARSGLLEAAPPGPGSYRSRDPLRIAELESKVSEMLAGISAVPADGGRKILAGYFANCASRQEELLRGEVSALEFLLPEGSSDVTEAMYASNPLAQVQNRSVSGAVCAYLAESGASEISVLEVGAGTGATSAQVLADLPAGRYRYCFTDVSLFFTERARSAFAKYGAVEYRTYDIDSEPEAQGLGPGCADVIIAANVLHNARNLDRTLRQLRPLLTPGGLLTLIENTVNEPFHLVTVGFYQDLGTYEDERILPLLTPERWIDRLRVAGFSQAAAVPPEGTASMGQHILLARAPAGLSTLDVGRLRGHLESLLPGHLIPQRYQWIDRIPLTANGKVDRSALPAVQAPAQPAAPVAPSTAGETVLLGIWRDVLMRDDFGVEDNFFELGGDSLHALAIIRRMRDELGVRATAEQGLQMLFDAPTIAEFGARLDREPGS
jgi:pyochelin synthetase